MHILGMGKGEPRQTVRSTARVEYDILVDRLKQLRRQAQLGQGSLSRKIGRAEGYVGKIESEAQLPDFVAILDICDAIGVDPAEVVAQVHAEAKKKRSK